MRLIVYLDLSVSFRLLFLTVIVGASVFSNTANAAQSVTNHRGYSNTDRNNSIAKNPLLCESTKCHSTNGKKLPFRSPISSANGASAKSTHLSSIYSLVDLHELQALMRRKRKKCKLSQYKGFDCQKVKWYTWLVNQFENNKTEINSYVELLRNRQLSDSALTESDLFPENWYENLVFELLQKWGSPVDQFIFHKYKEFIKSREVRLKVPHLGEVKVSPRVHPVAVTGRSTARWFFDPGFNLKLKLPFFKDELSKLEFFKNCFPMLSP
jgi:hypothetical protein